MTPRVEDIRGEIKDDPESLYLMDHPDSAEEIPTLDMAPYLAGEPGGREKVARHLREISSSVGFFYLRGHGIREAVIDDVFRYIALPHALPDAEKDKIPYISTDTFKSGYQAGAREARNTNTQIITGAKPDLNSKFSVNREGGSGGLSMSEEQRRAERNVWPRDLPEFPGSRDGLSRPGQQLGRQLLPLWATSLDLPIDYFEKYFDATRDAVAAALSAAAGDRRQAVRHRAAHRQQPDDLPGAGERFRSRGSHALGPLAAGRHRSRHAAGQHRQPDGALDQRGIPVHQAPGHQHQQGRSLFDPLLLRPERRCADRMPADLPWAPGGPPRYEPITYKALRQWYYNSKD